MMPSTLDLYTEFARGAGNRIRQALIASFGSEVGSEAAAEALAYGWENWNRVSTMTNPAGYLYAVGRNWGRRRLRRSEPVTMVEPAAVPDQWYEPALPAALARLTSRQRSVALLVHGYEWTLHEVAAVLGISRSTVQKHLDGAMTRLRRELGVQHVE